MGCLSKGLASILIVAMAVSCLTLMVKPASAQASPTPSVPEFTVKFVDNSYDVPPVPSTAPTYTTDPYWGNQTLLSPGSPAIPGYHVQKINAELRIKNQPFAPQFNSCTNVSLYYNVQVKGHYTNDWTEVYGAYSFSYPPTWGGGTFTGYSYPIQSNSEYTVLSIPASYPADGKVDFRVQAVIASVTEVLIPNFLNDYGLRPHGPSDYTSGTAWSNIYLSDWSKPQTITMPASSASTNPIPTLTISSPSPTAAPMNAVPELSWLVIVPLLLSMLTAAVIIARPRQQVKKV